jgi:hypothetical protein
VPAKARIESGKKKAKKRTLQTEVWYQLKIDSDGSQVFYDERGKHLGSVPRSDTDRVIVEVYPGKEADEQR